MKWHEIIKDTAWVVDDLLTPEESQRFIDKAIEAGIEGSYTTLDARHRNATRVELDDVEMAERIFERIKDHIPQRVVIHEACENLGLSYNKSELLGTWVPYELNSRWRIVCYPGSGHFGPHRDGCRLVDEHHRSLITINGYLTDRPKGFGGATRFVKDSIEVHLNKEGLFTTSEADVLHRVEADKAGKAVVFFHDLMHDGEPLKEESPPKWLFRTEILFERDPETAPKPTSEQKNAREFLQKAEKAEADCNWKEAMSFYNKAYRLDPSLH